MSYWLRPDVWFKGLSGLVTVISGTAVIALYSNQKQLVYPSRFPAGSREIVDSPEAFGLPYREEVIAAADGTKLRIYVISQPDARAAPTIIYFQGNAGNMGHRLPIAKIFHRALKCNFVMLSYRGYGLSEGLPSESGIKMDGRACLDWVRKDPLLGQGKVILYGQSLGGALSIDLASNDTGTAQPLIDGMILENTFLSIPKLIPHAIPMLTPFTFLVNQIWDSEKRLPMIRPTLPILFLSGSDDEIVPPKHMRTLYEMARDQALSSHSEKTKESAPPDSDVASTSTGNRTFKLFQGMNHNNTCSDPHYFKAIADWLQDNFPFVRESNL